VLRCSGDGPLQAAGEIRPEEVAARSRAALLRHGHLRAGAAWISSSVADPLPASSLSPFSYGSSEQQRRIRHRCNRSGEWRARWPPPDPVSISLTTSGVNPLHLSSAVALPLSLCQQPVGLGLAWPVKLAVLLGPDRHENQPIVSCLGQRLGPWSCEAQPWRHVVPCRPDSHRVVLSRAHAMPCWPGPLAIYISHRMPMPRVVPAACGITRLTDGQRVPDQRPIRLGLFGL